MQMELTFALFDLGLNFWQVQMCTWLALASFNDHHGAEDEDKDDDDNAKEEKIASTSIA